jgi:Tfp pilus assembly protein PilV
MRLRFATTNIAYPDTFRKICADFAECQTFFTPKYMKKLSTIMMLIVAVTLTGCAGNQNQTVTNEQSTSTKEVLTFNHALFALDLPAPFEANNSLIKPTREKDFPQIVYGVSKTSNEGSLLPMEEEKQKNLCGQTDACGKITENEEVTINDTNGIKFTVKYEGRSIDDPAGYILEYHYSLQNGENLFRFWTSANDLENAKNIKQSFENIMKTFVIE